MLRTVTERGAILRAVRPDFCIRSGGFGVLTGMDMQKPPAGPQQPQGCLVVAIRLPLRIVTLVLVVPVRMAWEALVVAGRFVHGTVLRPLGRALAWLGRVLFVLPLVGLWRYVVVPVAKALAWLVDMLVVRPLLFLHRWVLAPVGRAVRRLLRYLVVVPARWLYDWILAPVGRAVAWCAELLWRRVLVPVGRLLAVVAREVGDALGHAWRIAGYVSRAVGRMVGTVVRWILVEPLRWVYRTVLTPVGHVVRDVVLRPVAEAARAVGRASRQALAGARETVRQTRAEVRRMLFGGPPERDAVHRREPRPLDTRTLDSSTTRLTKD